ncbi:MAG: MATE family efflux transporter [Clostridia bacterium]|nr:MATE family efflux transporter [Clostridia bacterium]
MNAFETDLSKGNVGKQLIKFALPFIISNLIQSLYSVADMIIVGQFAGTQSMSGVNIGSQLSLLITNLVFGLGAGATVLIGQYLGANDRKALKETVGSLFTLLITLAAVLTFIMIGFRSTILNVIKTPLPAYAEAESYLIITSAGTIFIFMYNALSAVLRGMGDSKRPLYFVAIACFTNIFLDLLFVGKFKMKAFGAGLATVISQAVSVVLCINYLRHNDFVFDFGIKSFRFHPERTKMLLKVGVPMSVQNVCTTLSFLFLTAMVNILDPTAVASAAVGAVGKLNSFGVLPAFAMSNAISAMSAQNLGAGEIKRAVKTMEIGTGIGFAISAVVFLIARLFPAQLLSLFDKDPELIKAGVEYIKAFSYDYLLVPIFAGMNGLFIGAGHTTFSLFNGVFSSVIGRVPACYIFGMYLKMGLFGIGLGAPTATLLSIIIGFVYFFSGKWKVNKIVRRA